jgi:hypothetical protein
MEFPAYIFTKFPYNIFRRHFGYPDHIVLAFPLRVALTLSVVHEASFL